MSYSFRQNESLGETSAEKPREQPKTGHGGGKEDPDTSEGGFCTAATAAAAAPDVPACPPAASSVPPPGAGPQVHLSPSHPLGDGRGVGGRATSYLDPPLRPIKRLGGKGNSPAAQKPPTSPRAPQPQPFGGWFLQAGIRFPPPSLEVFLGFPRGRKRKVQACPERKKGLFPPVPKLDC
ncbi:uncharacterized protein LOC103106450 [Monodelphis domestica]|uniref:uncharacterized protein LOC103106450 n=1 Tax=Monodelphis domestica TaxID=13616 RepID=UPI0024E20822|nr:uncharacterized protein LOC103106450 [Monodelphis domestica]